MSGIPGYGSHLGLHGYWGGGGGGGAGRGLEFGAWGLGFRLLRPGGSITIIMARTDCNA